MKRPTPAELLASTGKTVPDVIAPGLQVLFCGINPGLYSGFTGHHFARPGNRFWPVLHAAGFTPRLLKPEDERELLTWGYGITNIVERSTAAADELTVQELISGGERLTVKVMHFRPAVLAVLGVTAFRTAFGRPKASIGPQDVLADGPLVWVLPNPSGLNAHYTPASLVHAFQSFRSAIEDQGTRTVPA